MTLHHCDKCNERTEVWKRTLDGTFFCYCINRGCPSNRAKTIDKTGNCGILNSHTPETTTPDITTGTTQMTYRDAEILIHEGRKLGYHGTDWEQSFLQRLEAMQPVILLPEDASVVEEFYRRATGGGYRTNKRSLSRTPADMGEF